MRTGAEGSEERTDLALIDALGLGASPGIVAIVGGGGKSSLLFALATLLPGRTVLTTTTKIFASQTRLASSVCTLDDPNWEQALSRASGGALVVGEVEDRHALGVPAHIPARILARPDSDWVIVEADGSRRLPVKAPAEHEPVVPPETGTLVTVAGLDALSAPICQIAHRPERVCAVTGMDERATLSPDALGRLLASERGGGKGAPPGARKVILINKVESEDGFALAREVARSALAEASVERVVAGALRGDPSSGWRAWLR
jgi:molybdenum cofactor cytidylyltransferase